MFKFIPIILLGAFAAPAVYAGSDKDELPNLRLFASEAEDLQKYDEDGDGVLSSKERKKMRAEQREEAKRQREERKQKKDRTRKGGGGGNGGGRGNGGGGNSNGRTGGGPNWNG